MLRKILLVGLVGAATVLALWRLGVLDERQLKHEASELRDSAGESARRAAEEAGKSAREAVDDKLRR